MTATQDKTTLTGTSLDPDVIARSSAAYALYNNGIWAGDKGANTVDTTTTYNSGSGTYSKPAGYDAGDTILVRGWGGGGSGSVGRGVYSASAGEGGSYFEIAYRYADFPSSATYSVGAAGANVSRGTDGATSGNVGGDTTVTVGSHTFTANGGAAGTAALTGEVSTTPISDSLVNTASIVGVTPFGAGNGGGASNSGQVSYAGGDAVHAGAGGGGAVVVSNPIHSGAAGGLSVNGGAGGAGASGTLGTAATATAGTAPGGGGGAAVSSGGTATSGAGAAGRVQFIVLRGWRPTLLSAP